MKDIEVVRTRRGIELSVKNFATGSRWLTPAEARELSAALLAATMDDPFRDLEPCDAYHVLCHVLPFTEGQAYGLMTDVRISGSARLPWFGNKPGVTVTESNGLISVEVR